MLPNVRDVLPCHHSQQLAHWLDLRYDSPSVVSGKRPAFPQEIFHSAQNDSNLDDAVQSLFLDFPPRGRQLSHRATGSSVNLDVSISEACFARLSYSYYPYLVVRVHGQEVLPFETYDRFLDLVLNPGEHHIEMRASLSSLRQLLIGTSIALFLLGISLSRREIRDHRRQ